MLERLDVVGIIDDVVGARRADAGASVGTYIALAARNRVVAPCSKLAFADWWAKTAGDRLVGHLSLGALDHRRFWDAMDAITAGQLIEIERRITEAMVEVFDLDLSGLVLDMTNFATYIDSANERAPIAQRGHAKQKRNDLRLVGLALVVSTDGGVPLLSHAYAGNHPDVTRFADVLDELVTRWGALAKESDQLTLVYDAGQDSEANQSPRSPPAPCTSSAPCHPRSTLTSWPLPKDATKSSTPNGFPVSTAFEARTSALGAEYRVIVTHSETFHAKQSRGLRPDLGQGPSSIGRAGRAARAGQDQKGPRRRRGRDRQDRQAPLGLSGHHHDAER